MANPRNIIDSTDIGIRRRTYIADGSTIVYDSTKARGAATTMLDKAVSLSTDDTIQLASDAERVIGKLLLVEADGKCTVQIGGHATFPAGDGATLTLGKAIVGALGAASAKGYIREVNTAAAAELGKSRGATINNNDTAAVVVDLDQ